MRFTLDSHKWIFDDAKYLGFVGINIYTYENQLSEFEIIKAINQGLLNEGHFAREIEINSLPDSFYGAFDLAQLEESDFTRCDDKLLEDCYNEYWTDKNWGTDLEVFKKHKTMVEDYLNGINFKSDQHFFLCQEWVSKNKNVNLNFFAYLVCVISISVNKIAVITYGGD